MKRTTFILPVAISLAIAAFGISCQSSAQKEKAAQKEVQDAKEDLREVQGDANALAQKVATAEEWKAFRIDSEEKIRNNETRIAELRVKMKKPGVVFDELYGKKIDLLQEQNRALTAKLDAYEKSQSNWETFKAEFNHDMEELGKALKDLTVDNK